MLCSKRPYLGKFVIVGPHHDSYDRDGYSESQSTRRLIEHKPPLPCTTPGILFPLACEVQGKLEINERAQLIIAQDRRRVAIRSKRYRGAALAQILEDRVKLRMKS